MGSMGRKIKRNINEGSYGIRSSKKIRQMKREAEGDWEASLYHDEKIQQTNTKR